MASAGIPKGRYTADPGPLSLRSQEVRRFNGFTANLTTRELSRGDIRIDAEPKICEMAALLLWTPGRIVTYREFKAAIWPDVQIELVENVNVLASKLRETLGEANGMRYVINKRGEGYYFNPKVTVECSVISPPEGKTVEAIPVVPTAESPRQSIRRNVKLWAMAAALAVLSIIAAAIWRQPQADDIKILNNSVIAVDPKGREIWRHVFPWALRETDYTAHLKFVHYWIGDLNRDGERQLVFGALPYNTMTDGTPVFCFRADGRMKWQFMPGHAVADSGGEMLPPYFANSVTVVQGKKPTDTRIAISSNHYLDYPDQVAFLDVSGKITGEYWHPGHLLHLAQADLDADGRKALLLGGVNNGDHQATLVVLDPLKISGAVTPKQMRDHRFELLGMPASIERAVLLFPRSCISIGQPYTRVEAVQVSRDRIVVEVIENIDETSGLGFVYELDYQLNVVNVAPMNGMVLRKAHQQLEAQGKLDHQFDSERECALLKAGVVVRRGN